eukprot:m.84262 g.84262  ORF g.84262 m.84262 type:complete len:115 (+) comp17779_c0_seq4:56-400(+)
MSYNSVPPPTADAPTGADFKNILELVKQRAAAVKSTAEKRSGDDATEAPGEFPTPPVATQTCCFWTLLVEKGLTVASPLPRFPKNTRVTSQTKKKLVWARYSCLKMLCVANAPF